MKEYELRKKNLAANGSFGFGITKHIDLGIKHDPSIGIFGMDFYVHLARPVYIYQHAAAVPENPSGAGWLRPQAQGEESAGATMLQLR